MITQAEIEFIHYKLGSAGSFRTALYEAFWRADGENRSKLESVFPDLEILRRYSNESGYWEDLQTRWNQHINQTSEV